MLVSSSVSSLTEKAIGPSENCCRLLSWRVFTAQTLGDTMSRRGQRVNGYKIPIRLQNAHEIAFIGMFTLSFRGVSIVGK